MADTALRKLLLELFDRQRSAALATTEEGQPFLSLMAFAAAPELSYIVLATRRGSRKFQNLLKDRRVALLIDNRTNERADDVRAIAVTILGQAAEADAGEREALRALFLSKHPHLKGFVDSPDCALVKVWVHRYLVVSRFEEVQELEIT
ncbi:MAG: pyridoxamine 5'-phosphate oxidase family protein [Deltaproteobacteria bacterium]|nr:pyridoxamine 5'-phosphate oxidase family protein [Deltaproteobacteria bacterium]